ncbi:hypothetical protein SZ64_16070 [Erythrobacter sp. SG61-1L]|uniref:hypothetical protein n=1 Tax=Erythrobacter sp. SG61-1L TaxID=1603897 RepID=UPI0006C91175|nr:hypothetical protein [Erythrobacter sp. SG61-1L]KPL69485.1 hypothetical protein SZ64_16070 [Erythrobacter sp. SG61-1L]
MSIFVITFDARKAADKQHDYTAFANELKKQKCLQIQRGTFLGSFNNSATQVHNHFRKFVHKVDSLLVNEMVQNYAYTGAAKNIAKWLELNPPAKLEVAKDDAAPAAKPAAKAAKKAPAKVD